MNFDNIHKKIDAVKGRLTIHARVLRPHANSVKSMAHVAGDGKSANRQTYQMLTDLHHAVSALPPNVGVKSDAQALVSAFAIFDETQQVVNYVGTIDRSIKTLERIQDALYKAESRISNGYSRRQYNQHAPMPTPDPAPVKRSPRK